MANQTQLTLLEDLKRAAWARTSPVSERAQSWDFRKDCLGNLVRYSDYGRRISPFGWELELIVPVRMGGTHDGQNLQALHWKASAARSEAVPRGILATEQAATPAEAVPA